jgi:hypothetical protein
MGIMGTGLFCRLDFGSQFGTKPVSFCAWSKEHLGWGTVDEITPSGRGTVSFPKADSNAKSIVRINTSDPNEYFLLENRRLSGYDEGFKGTTVGLSHGGLLIFHVNLLKLNSDTIFNNNVNNDENNKGLDVEEANEGSFGSSMLDTNENRSHPDMFFFDGNNTSFTNSTTPDSKLTNGGSTNVSLTQVSGSGDVMTAELAEFIPTPTPIPVPAVGAGGLSFLVFFLTLLLIGWMARKKPSSPYPKTPVS